jgi:hypothetical protein
MTKLFIFGYTDITSKTPLEIFKEIDQINPDKIIIDSQTECGVEEMYGKVFDFLEPWLEQHNKVVNVITPHLDNIPIRLRIIGERNYSNILESASLMIDNRGDLPPPKIHTPLTSVAPYFGNYKKNYFDILYTCYNNAPTRHRAKLVDILARENLIEQGIVTFHQPEDVKWQYHDGSRLTDEPDYAIFSKPEYNPINIPQSFHKGLFDIVGESHFVHKQITEKTLKSVLTFKPFIVNGCKGFHNEYLFEYIGLKPYTEMFDYSFDSCDSIEDRVEGIVDNVKRLSKLSVTEREKLYKNVIHKLVYNKSRIVELLYDKEKIVPDSLKFLMNEDVHEIYGSSFIIAHMYNLGWIKENITWVN